MNFTILWHIKTEVKVVWKFKWNFDTPRIIAECIIGEFFPNWKSGKQNYLRKNNKWEKYRTVFGRTKRDKCKVVRNQFICWYIGNCQTGYIIIRQRIIKWIWEKQQIARTNRRHVRRNRIHSEQNPATGQKRRPLGRWPVAGSENTLQWTRRHSLLRAGATKTRWQCNTHAINIAGSVLLRKWHLHHQSRLGRIDPSGRRIEIGIVRSDPTTQIRRRTATAQIEVSRIGGTSHRPLRRLLGCTTSTSHPPTRWMKVPRQTPSEEYLTLNMRKSIFREIWDEEKKSKTRKINVWNTLI